MLGSVVVAFGLWPGKPTESSEIVRCSCASLQDKKVLRDIQTVGFWLVKLQRDVLEFLKDSTRPTQYLE